MAIGELKGYESNTTTVQCYPDGHVLYENPPRFVFLPEAQADIRYTIEVSKSENFSKDTLVYNGVPLNFYTPDKPIPEGNYFWRYKIEHDIEYSKVRTFSVGVDLPHTPLVGRKERFANADHSHPRLWMNKVQINNFKLELKNDANYCRFKEFCEHSVIPCFEKEIPKEPDFFWGRTVNYIPWSRNWKECHNAMIIIRNLAFAGIILENDSYIQKSKQAVLSIAKWDPFGSTSRYFHDECTFRIIYGLAFGYDWLYDYLTEAERKEVLFALFIRTKCVADHTLYEQRLHVYPFQSHTIRSLSSVIIPACIVMLYDQSEAEEWLHYAIEYLSGIYPPWGGKEGGWSEGTGYWTSATSFVLSAMDNLLTFCGIDLFKRPFFHQTANFPLYCHPHETYGCAFSDGSSDDKPKFKTALNVQQFGAITGNPYFQWYYERCMERLGPYPPPFQQFYDDLFFLDVTFAYNHKPVAAVPPTNDRIVKWFKDVGWVAIHKNYTVESEHLMLLVKSSKYGSVSHSHADQNCFTLYAYGQPLLINSGFYSSANGGYASPMHCYSRQTLAHNGVLFDGKGQMTELRLETKRHEAKGEIISVTEHPQYVRIKADASKAYKDYVPHLKSFIRDVYYVDDSYIIVVDKASLTQEAQANFMLHSFTSFQLDNYRIHIEGEKADLFGEFVLSSSGIESITETGKYIGLTDDEAAKYPQQYHLQMNTNMSLNHMIVTFFCPVHKGGENTVTYTLDGQAVRFDNSGVIFELNLNQ